MCTMVCAGSVTLSIRLDSAYQRPAFFFFFFFEVHFFGSGHCSMGLVHCSRDSQTSFFNKIFIKMGLTALFTHLKIILL